MGVSKQAPNPTYTPLPPAPQGYKTFNDFYPFYLGEHSNPICRRLHLVGTSVSTLAITRVLLSNLSKVQISPQVASTLTSTLGLAGEQLLKGFARTQILLRLERPAWQWITAGVLQGYFFAWVGHFWFEKNKPATFKYPLFSFMGDLRLLWEVVTLQRKA